jgi:DNA replication protein DnaC
MSGVLVPNPSQMPIEALCRRLHLANAPRIWSALADRAEKEEWSFRDFLAVLLAEEVAHRAQTRVQRLTRRARFPFLKTIDDFDFTYQSTVRLSLLGSALSADFITEGRCLIFSGKPGRGKTHLAIAIAYRAIQNGFDALFTTAAAMIDDLSKASRHGRLADALIVYTHPAVLVIDEVGYLGYGPDAANVLFHVVNDRHLKRRSTIFTTNKALSAWGRVLHDPDLAAAIVDRALERGRHLQLDGPSIRTRHLGLDDPTGQESETQPARISGITPAEFPEPTHGPRLISGVKCRLVSSCHDCARHPGCERSHTRYCCGEHPAHRRNARVKFAWSEYPRSIARWRIFVSVFASTSDAVASRASATSNS